MNIQARLFAALCMGAAALGDALKQLGRPIDPTPPRTHSNLSATPAQKLGFKSLQGAKKALGKFGDKVRPKMAPC